MGEALGEGESHLLLTTYYLLLTTYYRLGEALGEGEAHDALGDAAKSMRVYRKYLQAES